MRVCVFKVYDLSKFDKVRLVPMDYDYNEDVKLRNLAESDNMTSVKETSRSVGHYLVETGIYEGTDEDAWKFINDVRDNCSSHMAQKLDDLI